MKPTTIAAAIALALICWSMTSCVMPNGTVIADPLTTTSGQAIFAEYQRQHPVRAEK